MDTNTISDELQKLISGVGRRDANNSIKTHFALRYYRRVIARVNKEEENLEGQKRNTTTGKIKFSGLSHKRENQSNPRVAWYISHKIYNMYSDIKNKEGVLGLR